MNSVLKERYSALFLFLFGLALWFFIPYEITADTLSTIGPDFFPKFIAVTVMVLSAGILLKTFVKPNSSRTTEEKPQQVQGRRVWAAVTVFILMFIYIFVIEWFGYLITTIVIMSLILWVLSSRKWYHYAILIALIVVIQYVFENIMYVQLP